MKQHGFAAQSRRRSDTGNSSGVTASQIREHLYTMIPELKEHQISLSTIRRLFHAPNKTFNASGRYKEHINARVGVKSNCYREFHEDAHYLFSRNKYRRELASLFPNEIGILSIDDMSKIKVGAPAVSRYHQIRSFVPMNDQPNLKDHDFPVPGYLLATSGYMFLEPKIDDNTMEPLSTAHDQELIVVNNGFQNMRVSGDKESIYDVLAHQLNIHLDVKATAADIKDEIRMENEGTDLQKFENEIVNENNVILKTAASLFLSSIVVFHESDPLNQQTMIQPKKSIEGPLYIFQHEDLSFESVSFINESTECFNIIDGFDEQNIKYDNLGRAHLQTPHTGPASLYVRSSKYNHSTISTHVTDLHAILMSDMEVSSRNSYMFVSDGGPDFSPSSVLNQLFLFRLFKTLCLDFFVVFTYAARYSAYNPIEHLWSKMSNKLSGVVFSSAEKSGGKPPIHQSGLTAEELMQKEKIVFDKAMTELESYWKDVNFDNHKVFTSVIKTNEDKLLFDDYETVKKFLACPLRDIHQYSSLLREYKCMFEHIDRHLNEIVFIKCDDRSCCEEWKSTGLKKFLQKFKMRLFAPSITTTCGHYDTFLQSTIKDENIYGSSGQPSCLKDDLGKCNICSSYHFKSKTEMARHRSLFHRRQKNRGARPKSFQCDVCASTFTSLPSLNRHKKAEQHTTRVQGRKRKRETSVRKTKSRTIHDMLSSNQSASNAISEDEEDDECSAPKCNINRIGGAEISWVECEGCSKWFHIFCVTNDESQKELEDFICETCVN